VNNSDSLRSFVFLFSFVRSYGTVRNEVTSGCFVFRHTMPCELREGRLPGCIGICCRAGVPYFTFSGSHVVCFFDRGNCNAFPFRVAMEHLLLCSGVRAADVFLSPGPSFSDRRTCTLFFSTTGQCFRLPGCAGVVVVVRGAIVFLSPGPIHQSSHARFIFCHDFYFRVAIEYLTSCSVRAMFFVLRVLPFPIVARVHCFFQRQGNAFDFRVALELLLSCGVYNNSRTRGLRFLLPGCDRIFDVVQSAAEFFVLRVLPFPSLARVHFLWNLDFRVALDYYLKSCGCCLFPGRTLARGASVWPTIWVPSFSLRRTGTSIRP
jgi:hypothetical protein